MENFVSENGGHEDLMAYSAAIVVAFTMISMSFLVFLIPGASSLPDVSDQPRNNGYAQPITDDMLGLENLSIRGRPLFVNEVTGDLYYSEKLAPSPHTHLWKYTRSTGVSTELNTSFTGNRLRGGIVCADGSLLIGQYQGAAVLRSTDDGLTWTTVLNMQAGTDPWRFETRGNYVYVGEYSEAATKNILWMSTDNGKVGTWVQAWQTVTHGVLRDIHHFHYIHTDPITNYVYVTNGDAINADCVARSTNGIDFANWGAFVQSTAIQSDANNIYFADDPIGRVVIYNKSTEEWKIAAITLTNSTIAPFYDMDMGEHGVLYARTQSEGSWYPGRYTGIHFSPNGVDWSFSINMTNPLVGTLGDADYHVISDHNGHVYFGNSLVRDFNNSYIWRFNDLTKEEAFALAKQAEPRSPTSVLPYADGRKGWDGGVDYASFGQDVLTDVKLNVTGNHVENLLANGEIPDGMGTINASWGGAGWAKELGTGEENNLSMGLSAKHRSDSTSVVMHGYNSSAYHGRIRYTEDWGSSAKRPLAGQEITISAYVAWKVQNTTTDWNGRLACTFVVLYSDFSDSSIGLIGGTWQPNYTAFSGNISNNEWSRVWVDFTIPAGKTMRYAIFDWHIYGIGSYWVDDLMIANKTGSPKVGLTPFIDGNQTQSVDVNVTVNGVKHIIGSLNEGEKGVVLLGTISGVLTLEWEMEGSKCVDWTIWGKKNASGTNALLSWNNSTKMISASKVYTGAMLEVWRESRIDVPSFLSSYWSVGEPVLEAAPLLGSVNITLLDWNIAGSGDYAFNANSTNAAATILFNISGIGSMNRVELLIDGVVSENWTRSGSTIQFGHDSWSDHTFVLRVHAVDANWAPGFLGIGIGIVIVIAVIATFGLGYVIREAFRGGG